MSKRDFLSLLDFSKDELGSLIERAKTFRKMHARGDVYQPLVGRTAAIHYAAEQHPYALSL